MAYRVYVTDSLGAITGAEGRYIDVVTGKLDAPKEEKTAEDIVNDVIAQLELQMG